MAKPRARFVSARAWMSGRQSPTSALAATLCFALAGCTTRPPVSPATNLAALPAGDAAYELARDRDLDMLRATFDTVAVGAEGRTALRHRLAAEYGRRIAWDLDHQDRRAAFEALTSLAGLWHPRELWAAAPAAGLADEAAEIERVRVVFSRSGGDVEATTALAMLMLAEPERAAWCQKEIAMIFDYADELAMADSGPGAERSRPIAILESVVEAFPSPFVVHTLSDLYIARQRALTEQFRKSGVDIAILRVHGKGALYTTWNIARIYALAMRLDEARKPALAATGFGADPEVLARLGSALSQTAVAGDWLALEAIFHVEGDDDAPSDWHAALRTAEAAIARFPQSAEAHAALAMAASQTGNAQLSIAHLEEALKLDPSRRAEAEKLAELYQYRVSQLAFSERPQAAKKVLDRWTRLAESSAKRWPDKPLSPDLADAYATMGGALVSLGQLDEAEGYLHRALKIRPTFAALESLGTVALKQGQAQKAITHFERALTLPVADASAQFDRNRVVRLCGEAYIAAGNASRAREYFSAALKNWQTLRKRLPNMPESYLADSWIETGKLKWALADRDGALAAFSEAIAADPDGASVHADIVAFLIIRGEYDRALEIYHAALSSYGVSDYFKVYMSLWLVAEARREKRPPDPIAESYLASREGKLWHDALARYASGREDLAQLEAAAKSRGQRAELLYYRAVLTEAGRNPQKTQALLEGVVRSDMILFFEYDMARHWLDEGANAAK